MRAKHRLETKHDSPSLIVFYDGWCGLCRRTVAVTKRWDWLGRLAFYDLRNPEVCHRFGLDARRAAVAVHAFEPTAGRWFTGARAMLELTKRVPAYWPLVCILAVGIRVGLGERVYQWVADHRRISPVGHCQGQACARGLPTANLSEQHTKKTRPPL
ncbi:thiol-disulfide oxidoreductase DCC family protein [Alicyclobacillus herbarius]|uniref:thiol-disulfide oxidoreductase DCC family protein n=1 Tax=Alicyclobacillus herbarius TaxID=122960 RepID=UPI000429A7D4|nr:DUF393 domain-containing protein [Alicyclobacillus herbarius]